MLSACGSGGGGSSSSSTIPPITVPTSHTHTHIHTYTHAHTDSRTRSAQRQNRRDSVWCIRSERNAVCSCRRDRHRRAHARPRCDASTDTAGRRRASDDRQLRKLQRVHVICTSRARLFAGRCFRSAGFESLGIHTSDEGLLHSVFAVGADGKSANAPLPVYAFSAVTNGALATQRVTTATVDEAADLAYLNASRVKANPAAPVLIFDETAEETAREHAQDMAANKILCHYDMNNVGPQSLYLRMNGLGGDGENAGFAGTQTPHAAFAFLNDWSISEGPGGGHYENIIATAHLWGGVATAGNAAIGIYGDDELVSPHSGAYTGYPNTDCSAGIVSNQS